MEHDQNAHGHETPRYCKEGSAIHRRRPIQIGGGGRGGGGRQYTVYDPKTQKLEIVDTCFSTFHLNFDNDPDNTIWSGGGGLVGWVNTKVLDETHDAGKAQGWAPLIVDTNGNGKRDAFVEPNEPVDPPRTNGSAPASMA